tara:strand:+ start:6604 stop:7605 length:1002 start_codon:yes stop_codon:yes gene_type:complete
MIFKSFEVENNIEKILKFKFILLYGENIGLKEVLKKKIINSNYKADIINLYQEDQTKNKNVLITEVKNVSLFVQKKIIIVNQINEKIIAEVESLLDCKEDVGIILIGDLLDKKSKLRNLFEKASNLAIVPCYNDNDITLRKLVQNELKDFKNLNSNTLNMILSYSNLNRKTILNNLDKIKSFFDKKELSEVSLEILLNSDRNEMFENIRDAALDGNKAKLNHLFSNFAFSNEESFLYINMINYRLIKLLEIHKQNEKNNDFNVTISKMRPPIFWKDKPVFHRLLKRWDISSVIDALRYLGQTEEKLKKNSNFNNLTMVKNSITNICTNSWAYF